METRVLGLSVDSVPCLTAWAKSLGGITYPLLSDFYPHGEVAKKFGVLRSEGIAERAIFILDREGVIRHVNVYDIANQPNIDDLFEALAAMDPAAAEVLAKRKASEGTFVRPKDDVVVFCTPWCTDCAKTKEFLGLENIRYVEVDISRDRGAAVKVREWAGGKEVTPTVDVGGKILVNPEHGVLKAAVEKG